MLQESLTITPSLPAILKKLGNKIRNPQKRKLVKRLKDNLSYIAIGLYIAISLLLILMPKRWILRRAKQDFGVTEAEWKRKDAIGYYRILLLMGGLVTVALMLILKYIIL